MQDSTSAAAAELIADLARAMHSVSLPTDVIEEVLRAAASSLGLKVELMVMQSGVLLEFEASKRRTVEFQRLSRSPHWRLEKEHELMRLARSLADGSRGVEAGRVELERIEARPHLYPGSLVVGAYSLYGAASAARAGGRWLEMLVGALLGLLGGLLQTGAARHPRLALQKSFLAALCATAGTLVLALVLPPFAAAPALYGGILLFVPAMATTTAVHELASHSVEAGSTRLMHAFLIFALLATGIGAAASVWTVFGPLPAMASPHAFSVRTVLAILVVGSLGLMGVLEVRLRDAAWVVAAVLLAWGLEQLTKLAIPGRGSPLVAAFVLGVLAYPCTRRFGRSPSLMLVPGLLQLTPGFVGTEALLHLMGGKGSSSDTPFRVILVAAQLTLGILLAEIVRRPKSLRIRRSASKLWPEAKRQSRLREHMP